MHKKKTENCLFVCFYFAQRTYIYLFTAVQKFIVTVLGVALYVYVVVGRRLWTVVEEPQLKHEECSTSVRKISVWDSCTVMFLAENFISV